MQCTKTPTILFTTLIQSALESLEWMAPSPFCTYVRLYESGLWIFMLEWKLLKIGAKWWMPAYMTYIYIYIWSIAPTLYCWQHELVWHARHSCDSDVQHWNHLESRSNLNCSRAEAQWMNDNCSCDPWTMNMGHFWQWHWHYGIRKADVGDLMFSTHPIGNIRGLVTVWIPGLNTRDAPLRIPSEYLSEYLCVVWIPGLSEYLFVSEY